MFRKALLSSFIFTLFAFGLAHGVCTGYSSYYRKYDPCSQEPPSKHYDQSCYVPSLCWWGWLEVGGEALFWKSCSGFEHAFLRKGSEAEGTDTILNVASDHWWGGRVYVGYRTADCGFFIKVSGLYFDSRHNQTNKRIEQPNQPVENLFIPTLGTVNGFQKVAGSISSQYANGDLRAGGCIHSSCWARYCAYGNTRYIYLIEKRGVVGIDPLEGGPRHILQQKTTFQGVGPGVGVTGEWGYCGLGLATRLGMMAIIGDRQGPRFVKETGDNLEIKQLRQRRAERICIPALDFKIGVNLTFQCSCFQISGEIGYELNHYFHALAFRNLFYRNDQNQSRELNDAGFAGPYARLSCSF